MFRPIAYLAVLATALFAQSSEAEIMSIPVKKIDKNQLILPVADPKAYSGRGVVKLKYSSHNMYIGDVQIGTPPQNFKMIFDMGSMVIWVPNSKIGNHAYYNSAASSTFIKNGTYYQIIYDDYSLVSGFVSVDTIRMGGLTFPNTKIMEASNTTGFPGYKDMPFDGIFGLGLDVEGPYKLSNPVQKMAMDGHLDQPQFAFSLNNKDYPELTLGGVNPTRYTGPINYVPVVSTGEWWIKSDKITFGNTVVAPTAMYAGMMDHGSSYFAAPPGQIQMIVKELNAEQTSDGNYAFDCTAQAPALTFTLGGKPYVFEKADYMLKDSQGNCILAITDSGDDQVWLLGTLFLQKYYTVFDFGTKTTGPRVGFAQAT